MRILVTGVAGFIGSNLADFLLAAGHEVVGLDDLSSGRMEDVPDGVDFVHADVRDYTACLASCSHVEVVYHEAALASVPRSVEDPVTTGEVNIEGTLNILRAAHAAGTRRVVYAASSSAYGGLSGLCREDACAHPCSPYAVSKLTGEHYCEAFWKTYGLPTISLRYFNIFGPRQRPDGPYAAVVARWAEILREGSQEPEVYGDGTQTRDFTYIQNVIEANARAGLSTLPDAAFGQTYNVGCGASITLVDLARRMSHAFQCAPRWRHGPPRPGDVQDSLADLTKAAATLGYRPVVDLDEGLRRYADWIQRSHSSRQTSAKTD